MTILPSDLPKANLSGLRPLTLALVVATMLGGCGGSSNDASIGGTLSGLVSGLTVTLEDNGASSLTLSSNGNFTFESKLGTGDTYDVTVTTQPLGQTCTVANGSGTVNATDNVTNVAVTCAVTASITGTLTGLNAGGGVTLTDGSVLLPIAANGTFVFPGTLAAGSAYALSVSTQPAGQTCTISNATGTVPASQIVSVTVACV